MLRIIVRWIVCCFIACSCGPSNFDPTSPEGSHNLFVRSLADRDYRSTYGYLTQSCRTDFLRYLDTTRAVVRIIRERYPPLLRSKAIADLSLRLPQASFTYEEIETGRSEAEIFAVLCDKMFADTTRMLSFMERWGTRIAEVQRRSEDSATVITYAGEELSYVREPDGVWRTNEIFGRNFLELVRVSRSNLRITRSNAELYAQ
jgi:hypothetical protein